MRVFISAPEVPLAEHLSRFQDYVGVFRRPSVIYVNPISNPTVVQRAAVLEGTTVYELGAIVVSDFLAAFPEAKRVTEIIG